MTPQTFRIIERGNYGAIAQSISAPLHKGECMGTQRTNETARAESPRAAEPDSGKRPELHEPAPAARKHLVSSADVLIGLGFGCYTSWVSMAFHSMGLFATGDGGERVLDTVYLVSIITITAVLFLSAALHVRVGKLIARPEANIVFPVGVTASTLLMPLSSMNDPLGVLAIGASGVLSGVFSGLQLLIFGTTFARLQTRSLVAAVASGQVAASLLFALSLNFPIFEAALFAASMPCVGALLLHFGMKDKAPDELNDITPLSRQELPDGTDRRTLRTLVARMCACVLLVGFANEAARTMYLQIEASIKQIGPFSQVQAFVAFAASAGVILIALAAVSSKIKKAPQICYHVLGMGLTAGVLLLPAILIYPALDARAPLTVNAAFYTCFGMFMWLVTAGICRQYSAANVRTVALVRGAWAAGPLLGMLLARFALHSAGTSLEAVFPIMVLGVIAVFAAANAAFDGTVLLQALELIPTERRKRFQEKCHAIAEHYGLSEREEQVMTLFAKGRNLEYIKDELHLSKSTVSTHRQHIYQKLGVHSQQEMLDLIQDAED